jgi:hypothetical protein
VGWDVDASPTDGTIGDKEDLMGKAAKPDSGKAKPAHPPAPAEGKPDIWAAHESIANRYAKTLAALAK